MCFSSNASFIAAGILSTLGVVALRKAHQTRLKPLASIPLFFGIQQALEGIIWLTTNHADHTTLQASATYAYVFFSHAFWPFFIPFALFFAEQNPQRKNFLTYFCAVGTSLAAFALALLFIYPVHSEIMNHSIFYKIDSPEWCQSLISFIYCIPVVLPLFVSSTSYSWLLGIALTLSLFISYIFYYVTLGSVWCFFSALLSIIVIKIIIAEERKK